MKYTKKITIRMLYFKSIADIIMRICTANIK